MLYAVSLVLSVGIDDAGVFNIVFFLFVVFFGWVGVGEGCNSVGEKCVLRHCLF